MKKFIDVSDVLILFGISFVTAGIWQIYHPAAFIFAGVCSMTAGILGLRQVK